MNSKITNKLSENKIEIFEKLANYSKEIIDNLKTGALLTVSSDATRNTMTIAWGTIGIKWFKPIFTAMVRENRYTKTILDKSNEFTVTIPLLASDKTSTILKNCGTTSGRDIDKFNKFNLKTNTLQVINTPYVAIKNSIVLACKVIYKQKMDDLKFDETFKEFYKDHNYHTIYDCSIVDLFKF